MTTRKRFFPRPLDGCPDLHTNRSGGGPPRTRARARPKPRRRRRKGKKALVRRWWLLAAVGLALGVATAVAAFLGSIPLPDALPGLQSSKVLASDGQLIALLHAEEDRTIVPLSEMAKSLQDAVVATEDRDFYSHPGVSTRGILRAMFTNVRSGRLAQGGSTITQQYVRNAFASVGKERTILRKLREAALSVKLERRFSKSKILEFYLNTVYFGRGAYGAEAAARAYFKKSARDLTITESAYLAGVIRSPQRYQPEDGPEVATRIRDIVLDDMVRVDYLKRAEAEALKKEKVEFVLGTPASGQTRAAFFVEYVRRILGEDFGLSDGEILGGGLQIHTTLDLRMQDAAEAAVSTTLDRPDDPEVALVAMDRDGNVRSMVGGRDVSNPERARQFNFAYQKGGQVGGRQPGSAFKPFTLAAFVDAGKSVNSTFLAPGSIVIPSKQCKDKDGSSWDVSNYDVADHGQLSVLDATAGSINTVYAQMVDLVGPRRVSQLANLSGISSELPAVCSIALGTLPVTPLEMSRAFVTFATRGRRPDVVAVTKIVGRGGRVIAERQPAFEQVIKENVADTVNHALQQVVVRGTGRSAAIGRPAAGKTGTTENHVDAWFAGYTPDLVAVVWIGYPPKDGKIPEMTNVRGREVVGGRFPAVIWKKFMSEVLKDTKASSFHGPSLDGEVVVPSPTPCPPGATPAPGFICASPSPSPSPETSASQTPSPSPSPTKPSPSPSSPSPQPSD